MCDFAAYRNHVLTLAARALGVPKHLLEIPLTAMNIDDGHIRIWSEIQKLPAHLMRAYRPMMIPPTPKQQIRKRISRNDPCPCGSGKKFKKCCLLARKR